LEVVTVVVQSHEVIFNPCQEAGLALLGGEFLQETIQAVPDLFP